MFKKLGSPGCACCPAPTPPTGCTKYCVNAFQASQHGPNVSAPLAYPVTILGTLAGSPWSTSGTSGGTDGFCYTLPDTDRPTITGATITVCGRTATAGFVRSGTTCTASFLVCEITVNASINPDAAPTIDISPPNANWSQTTTGSNVEMKFCFISCCFQQAFQQPVTFTATSTISGVYPTKCVTVDLDCQDDISIDLTQEDFSACYFPGGCDLGCDWGDGPNYRSVFSKNIECTWNSGHGVFAAPNQFADDEGQPIVIAGAQTFDTFGRATGVIWDSGCRGPHGNFQSSASACGDLFCSLNKVVPYERLHKEYGSTQIIITPNSAGYFRWPEGDCTFMGRCVNVPCGYNNPGFGCACVFQGAGGELCSPCSTGTGSNTSEWFDNETITNPVSGVPTFVSFRPLICAPMDYIVGVGNIGYGGSPFAARTDIATALFLPTSVWYVRIRETC